MSDLHQSSTQHPNANARLASRLLMEDALCKLREDLARLAAEEPKHHDLPELWGDEPVVARFPLAFANGKKWTEFSHQCSACHQNVPGWLTRGTVSQFPESTYTVRAVSYCEACKLFTPLLVRLHDDWRFSWPEGGVWKQRRMEKEKQTGLAKLLGFITGKK